MDATEYNRRAKGQQWQLKDLPKPLQEMWGSERPQDFNSWVEIYQALHGLVCDGKLGPRTAEHMTSTDWMEDCVLRGKGMWLWVLKRHLPDIPAAIRRMKNAGIRHVLYKVADGVDLSNDEKGGAYIEELLKECKKAGIVAAPWVFAYCYDDNHKKFLRQIDKHMGLAMKYEAPCFVVNAEHGFLGKLRDKKTKKVRARKNYQSRAEEYSQKLQELGIPVYISSYGKANHTFPYDEFCEHTTVAAPQIYTGPHGKDKKAVAFFNECVGNWTKHTQPTSGGPRPICPSIGNYKSKVKNKETGKREMKNWHTPKAIRDLLEHANDFRLPGMTIWLYLPKGYKGRATVTDAQWDACKSIKWWSDE